jgi:hypothetical protein
VRLCSHAYNVFASGPLLPQPSPPDGCGPAGSPASRPPFRPPLPLSNPRATNPESPCNFSPHFPASPVHLTFQVPSKQPTPQPAVANSPKPSPPLPVSETIPQPPAPDPNASLQSIIAASKKETVTNGQQLPPWSASNPTQVPQANPHTILAPAQVSRHSHPQIPCVSSSRPSPSAIHWQTQA